jgi:transposase
MEMATTDTVLQGKDTAIKSELYMSFELADKLWKVTASDGVRGPSRYTVKAGDTVALTDCIRKAKQRCKLEPTAQVHSCYEALTDAISLVTAR